LSEAIKIICGCKVTFYQLSPQNPNSTSLDFILKFSFILSRESIFFIESNAIAKKFANGASIRRKSFAKYMPEMTRDKLLPKIYFGQLDSR